MMFTEYLTRDAATVFLNPAEFGGEMVIDGVAMPAMWGEENTPASDIHGTAVDAWGLNTETAVLLVLENSMALPVPGQSITVDGNAWQVVKARPQTGILRLELERNVS